jgi:Uma2 family endonuclease
VSIRSRRGLFIPDVTVLPKKLLPPPGVYVPAGETKLIVEITSQYNASNDRVSKLDAYAQAEAPVYLLVDAWHSTGPTVTVYSEPEDGVYRVAQSVAYGKELRLPDPFDVVLDTSLFPLR